MNGEVVGKWKDPVWVDTADLMVDNDLESPEAYQRHNLTPFADNRWHWDQYDPIRVCRRSKPDDTFELKVVDGGRRVWNAYRFSLDRLPAFVEDSTCAAEEARVFLTIAGNKKALESIDRLRAAIVAGDPRSVDIKRVLDKHGLKLAVGKKWPCVNAAWYLQRPEPWALDFAFGVIVEIWDGHFDALRGVVFGGLAMMRESYKDKNFDRQKFVDRLKLIHPLRVVQEARLRGGRNALETSQEFFRKLYTRRNKKHELVPVGANGNGEAHEGDDLLRVPK